MEQHITAQQLLASKVLCSNILGRPLKQTNRKNYTLVVFFQPGNTVRQHAGVVWGQQIQEAVVILLGVQFQQRRVDVLSAPVGHLCVPHLSLNKTH